MGLPSKPITLIIEVKMTNANNKPYQKTYDENASHKLVEPPQKDAGYFPRYSSSHCSYWWHVQLQAPLSIHSQKPTSNMAAQRRVAITTN